MMHKDGISRLVEIERCDGSQIDVFKDDPDHIAYGLHSKLSSYIGTYNQIRVLYKAIATTWMIITGLGMLYLASGEEPYLSITNIPSTALFGVLSLVGVFAIFYWDVFVYTRHLHAVYHGLVSLESAYNSLSNSFLIQKDLMIKGVGGPEIYDGYLYATYSFVLLTVIGVSIARRTLEINAQYVSIIVAFWSVLSAAILIAMVFSSRSAGSVILTHHQKAD
jgi:hypothetical protein